MHEPPRRFVADEHHRDEMFDPEGTGPGGQAADERRPDTAALPGVGDRARELRLRRVIGGAHEPRRADALAVPGQRHQPLVGVVVHIAQFGQLARSEILDRPAVAPKPRYRPEVREGDPQLVAVVGETGRITICAPSARRTASPDGGPGAGSSCRWNVKPVPRGCAACRAVARAASMS